MANKLSKKKLDLLIEEVLSEDFSRSELGQVFTKKIAGADLSRGRDTGLPPAGFDDAAHSLV